jgi:homoserine kinase type II
MRFDSLELAKVLSHYDLGVIEQLRTYARGSPRAPKVRIRTRRGDFLLKRRAPGRDDPYRVAFAQSIQIHLVQHGCPVPKIIGTRDDNNSMLQLDDRIYEVFQYMPGIRYDNSTVSTESAGKALATLHRLLADYQSPYEPPHSSYHAAAGIDAKLARIPEAVAAREPKADHRALDRTCRFLRKAYHQAARRVDETGFGSWRRGVIHGDWHPGNLLFKHPAGPVSAILDFDSARMEPLMVDLANAALQFSVTWARGGDPAAGPRDLDLARLNRLMRGYDQASGNTIDSEELAALPWLMTEALVLESVIPIAATGTFGQLPGSSFLRMVEGKVQWITPRADELIRCMKVER